MKKDTNNKSQTTVEKVYKTTEVSKMLDIAVPTVRKYSQLLEKKGYYFLRGKGSGQHKARLFVEKDITVLTYLKNIREKSNMKVEDAIDVVLTRFNKDEIQSVSHKDIEVFKQYDIQYEELKGMILTQNKLIKSLTENLDKQQQYFEQEIKIREKMLVEEIKRLEEYKKESIEEKRDKKGFIGRFFGKA